MDTCTHKHNRIESSPGGGHRYILANKNNSNNNNNNRTITIHSSKAVHSYKHTHPVKWNSRWTQFEWHRQRGALQLKWMAQLLTEFKMRHWPCPETNRVMLCQHRVIIVSVATSHSGAIWQHAIALIIGQTTPARPGGNLFSMLLWTMLYVSSLFMISLILLYCLFFFYLFIISFIISSIHFVFICFPLDVV